MEHVLGRVFSYPTVFLTGIVTIWISVFILKCITQRRQLMQRLQKKLEEIKIKRDNLYSSLTFTLDRNTRLTDLDFSSLVKDLTSQKITTVDILKAYQKEALSLANFGCLAEPITEAYGRALSNAWSSEADVRGPLWGIPVTLKESIAVKGIESPLGMISRIGKISSADSVLVQILKKVGAIPFMTSSMSPAGCSLDCSNFVYGKQTNPLKANRSAGGSSGGEAILLAKHGSILGFGTDSAGSLRIPAAFCGVVALKPTRNRLSKRGINSPFSTSSSKSVTCVGPMARDVNTLASTMKAICCSGLFELDPEVAPIPFKDYQYMGHDKPYLRIGYFTSFPGNLVPISVPSVNRAILEAVNILTNNGHKIIDFPAPNPELFFEIGLKNMFPDGGKSIGNLFYYEPLTSSMRSLVYYCWLPTFLKKIVSFLTYYLYAPSVNLVCRGLSGFSSVRELVESQGAIDEFRQNFLQSWLSPNGEIDAIICPVYACPAFVASDSSPFLNTCLAYTILFNMTNQPAGTLPITTVMQDDVTEALRKADLFNEEADYQNAYIHKQQQESHALPVGIQIVALPYKEEVVLRLMKELEMSVQQK